jgi:hypothetical protein
LLAEIAGNENDPGRQRAPRSFSPEILWRVRDLLVEIESA